MNARVAWWTVAVVLAGWGLGERAGAQSSSLYGDPLGRPPLSLESNSWLFIQVDPPRRVGLHDQLTVIVLETSETVSEGQVNRQQQTNIDARLRDWIELDGFGIGPAPQAAGDPRARASLDSLMRTNMELETSDVMKLRITATVVDVRPNGNLVIEAHKTIRNNNEMTEVMLSGIVRPEDITPKNTVLSENIAELRIEKRETGHVRDAYRRGWFLEWLDRYKPF